MPAGWVAVANGAELSRDTAGDRTRIRYGETQPIPTYLFAFAAGQFQVETAERNGRTFRMFHRETDAKKVARNRDGGLRPARGGARLARKDYTGIPYPFGKFDFVLVPSFQFGGMEHPGAIFYNAVGDPARRVGDREPDARPREPDRARDVAHVVRRSRHDAVVQRRVDEGGVRRTSWRRRS